MATVILNFVRLLQILAQVQLVLPQRVSTPSKNSVSKGITKLPSKTGLTEEVVDSIERIDTQLSAFRFCSRRVGSDDRRARSRKPPSVSIVAPMEDHYETQRLSEKALMERRQSYEASVSGLRSNYTPMRKQMIHQTPSVTSPAEAIIGRRESQGSSSPPDDQFVRVRSKPPLPPPPVRKPSQSNITSRKTLSIKPTLLDQETETWDEEDSTDKESGKSRSETSSEDEEEESEETSGERRSNSGSSWETQGESGTESYSSDPPQSEDDGSSEVSDSPPRKKRDRSSDYAKKTMGRFKRLKDKIGQVFHHHHHHHHHHHEKEQGRKPLQSTIHQKDKEKSTDERRSKSESKGLTTRKHKGVQFHTLVDGLMRHKKHSKKQKQKLPSHGRKKHWWKIAKRQRGLKFLKN